MFGIKRNYRKWNPSKVRGIFGSFEERKEINLLEMIKYEWKTFSLLVILGIEFIIFLELFYC